MPAFRSPASRVPRPGLAALLFTCLFAVQASFLTVAPVLSELASEFGISTAAGGQLRTASGLAGALTALAAIVLRRRLAVERLLGWGLAALALGAVLSAAAPSFTVLLLAQLPVGAGLALVLTGGIAAAAEWTSASERPRVLAWALLGQPGAWVVGMPVIGVVAGIHWRLAWLAVPFTVSVTALMWVRRRRRTHVAAPRAARDQDVAGACRSLWRRPEVAGWAVGELFAFTAWAGMLVYAGALLVETYGLSLDRTGLLLGAVAAAYFPGALYGKRFITAHARTMLIGLGLLAAAGIAAVGSITPGVLFTGVLLAVLMAVIGARTLAASALGLSAAPDDRVAITAIRAAATQLGYLSGAALGGAALALGGYAGLTRMLALASALAVAPHLALLAMERRRRAALSTAR